eukprot:3544191-Prorocentrum_lima.AAC.1
MVHVCCACFLLHNEFNHRHPIEDRDANGRKLFFKVHVCCVYMVAQFVRWTKSNVRLQRHPKENTAKEGTWRSAFVLFDRHATNGERWNMAQGSAC